MPESKCFTCGELIVGPTMEALEYAERSHHERSLGKGEPINGGPSHGCYLFEVFDEGGVKKVGEHIFAHGFLERTNDITMLHPRLRD